MKSYWEKIASLIWSIQQVLQAAPREAISLTCFLLVQGVMPGFGLFVLQQIVDWVSRAGLHGNFPFFLLATWAAMLLTETVIEPMLALNRSRLNERVLVHCNLMLMRKANLFEWFELFENQKTYNDLQFLKEEAKRKPLNFVYIIAGLFRTTIALAGVLVMLACIKWWLPFFVLLSAIPHAISTVWSEKRAWDMALFRSPEARKMAWLASVPLEEKSAKELRLFGFGEFLIARYKELALSPQSGMSPQRKTPSVRFLSPSLLTVLGHLCSFAWLIVYSQRLGGGSVIMGLQALLLAQREMGVLMQNIGMLTQTLLFFDRLKAFLTMSIHPAKTGMPLFGALREGIRFENVSFSFPDGRQAIRNVNLHIKPGEKVALVGENGAGKSTLVKLLLRFYDPTEGRILVDGIDLREWDLVSWRKSISAVFQEFGQYQFTAAENIGIADPASLADLDAIILAAKKGGFSSVAEELPDKYQTLLGKEFGGTNLSRGQWQKLAISRAFMKKEAKILILDEPTAALDPKGEREVFQKFAEISKNKTAILITHRLGSVSKADQIIVMKEGRVVEMGSHEELFNAGQGYASLYSMQAELYSVK